MIFRYIASLMLIGAYGYLIFILTDLLPMPQVPIDCLLGKYFCYISDPFGYPIDFSIWLIEFLVITVGVGYGVYLLITLMFKGSRGVRGAIPVYRRQ
jgi:hypothetical protein